MTQVYIRWQEPKQTEVEVDFPLYRKREIMVNDYVDQFIFERVTKNVTVRVTRTTSVTLHSNLSDRYEICTDVTHWHTDATHYSFMLGLGNNALSETEFFHEYMTAIEHFDKMQANHA